MMAGDHDPIPGWQPPSASQRRAILDRSSSIAVVGASSNAARASNFVITYLLGLGNEFRLYLVNPRETEILGHVVHPSLESLPEPPDIVDVFRKPADLPSVATEAVEIGASTFWAQLGLWSNEAATIAVDGGLDVVMDRCLKIEHARFTGGLGLAGFSTGVISSRRSRR